MANLPSLRKGSNVGELQDPFRAMMRMQREMDRMFDNFWSGDWTMSLPELPTANFQPLCNVEEKGSHFLLSFDVPGFSKDDIKVEIQDNQLHVYGEKKSEHEEKRGKNYESERSYGSFDRWFTLPQNLKAEGIEARVEHGVLEVAVPKSEASKAKEIKIGEGKNGFFSKLLEKKEKAA